MQAYLDLVRDIFDNGSWQDNRTGIRTRSLPGAMLKFDLQQASRRSPREARVQVAIGELVGFLRQAQRRRIPRARLQGLGPERQRERTGAGQPVPLAEDDLGPVYGVQWREWPAYKLIDLSLPQAEAQVADALARGYARIGTVGEGAGSALLYKAIDQLRQCLDTIVNDPGNRRILFHGWNWAQIEEMALPPCHLLYQFLCNPAAREISLCLYIRSNDVGLGTPFNLTEGAALLTLVGRLTGYTPRWFTYFIGDAHIYENHVEMLQEQLRREPLPAPRLILSDRIPDYAVTGRYEPEWLEKVEPGDFSLDGYRHHPPLTAPMAV
jgi:thymidylate synthase